MCVQTNAEPVWQVACSQPPCQTILAQCLTFIKQLPSFSISSLFIQTNNFQFDFSSSPKQESLIPAPSRKKRRALCDRVRDRLRRKNGTTTTTPSLNGTSAPAPGLLGNSSRSRLPRNVCTRSRPSRSSRNVSPCSRHYRNVNSRSILSRP